MTIPIPEGRVIKCTRCPAELADTRGGHLVHHVDGSHTYMPPAVEGGCTCWACKARAEQRYLDRTTRREES